MSQLSIFGNNNMISSATESSSHQLVGYVTKMFPTFGYVNNEIFFQRKCVIGPMVEVGDHVATNAIYQPNMPIKWSAEKVWRIQDSHSRLRDKGETCWMESSKTKSPISRSELGVTGSIRNVEDRHHTPKATILERKRQNPSRSPASQIKSESDIKRRRESVADVNSRSIDYDSGSIRILHDVKLYNKKELVVPDFQRHFQKVLPPVHLYRINCHWQDSFPLLKPFQLLKNTVFQTVPPAQDVSEFCAFPPSDGYSVNVLLLSMPSTSVLQEKISSRLVDGDDPYRRSLKKYIKVLAYKQSNNAYKAIGGSWDPEKDGSDPSSNPKALINTAVRCCKEQIGLDLSLCTHWHRFMEFRYSRTEGLTARPASVLFPGPQQWGHAGYSGAEQQPTTTTTTGPSSSNAGGGTTASAFKPFHRIVVYLVPDLTPLVPSDEDWPDVKAGCEHRLNFPDSVKEDEDKEEDDEDQDEEEQKSMDTPAVVDATNPRRTSQPPNPTGASDETVRTLPATSVEQNSSATSSGTGDEHKATVVSGSAPEASPSSMKSDHEDGTTAMKSHDEFNPVSMKVSELREQLKVRNLPADGIRAQLIARLKVAVEKEAEEAKKAEDERKQREKENQETQAALAKVESKSQPVEKPPSIAKVSIDNAKNDEVKKITLRNIPSVIIHQLRHMVYNVPVEAVLDQKPDQMNSEVYEFMFCMKGFLDMLRRDARFILFRALVSAADRGVQAKPTQRSATGESSARSSESSDHLKQRGTLVSNHKSAAIPTSRGTPASATSSPRIVDVPLLYACSLFDINNRGYFSLPDIEDLIFSLALPVSRYQVRSLLAKVSYHQRIHYRILTDAAVDQAANGAIGGKPVATSALYSDIDDDEYLLELVRGGDAILDDDQKDDASVGSILLLRSTDTHLRDSAEVVGSASEITAPDAQEFVRQLRRSELENVRLMSRIQSQAKEIENMANLNRKISLLEKKLTTTSGLLDDYRLRARRERDRVHAVQRSLEKQAFTLDLCRTAVQQAAERLRSSSSGGQRSSGDSSPREAYPSPNGKGLPPPSGDGQTITSCAGENKKPLVVVSDQPTAASCADRQAGGHEDESIAAGQPLEETESRMEEETNTVEVTNSLPRLMVTETSVSGSAGESNEPEKSDNTTEKEGSGRPAVGQMECDEKKPVEADS